MSETHALSLMDIQCERFKSASSKAGAKTNLVFTVSQAVQCVFIQVKSSRSCPIKAWAWGPNSKAERILPFSEAPQLWLSWMFLSLQLPIFYQAEDETQIHDLLLTYLSLLLGAIPSTIGWIVVLMVFRRHFACCEQVIHTHWSKSPRNNSPNKVRKSSVLEARLSSSTVGLPVFLGPATRKQIATVVLLQ